MSEIERTNGTSAAIRAPSSSERSGDASHAPTSSSARAASSSASPGSIPCSRRAALACSGPGSLHSCRALHSSRAWTATPGPKRWRGVGGLALLVAFAGCAERRGLLRPRDAEHPLGVEAEAAALEARERRVGQRRLRVRAGGRACRAAGWPPSGAGSAATGRAAGTSAAPAPGSGSMQRTSIRPGRGVGRRGRDVEHPGRGVAVEDLADELRRDRLARELLRRDLVRLQVLRDRPAQQQAALGPGRGDVGQPGLLLGIAVGGPLLQLLVVTEPLRRPSEPAELDTDPRGLGAVGPARPRRAAGSTRGGGCGPSRGRPRSRTRAPWRRARS